jgi:hypothetical protein
MPCGVWSVPRSDLELWIRRDEHDGEIVVKLVDAGRQAHSFEQVVQCLFGGRLARAYMSSQALDAQAGKTGTAAGFCQPVGVKQECSRPGEIYLRERPMALSSQSQRRSGIERQQCCRVWSDQERWIVPG